jgi:spore maturation protein CgeB
MDEIQLQVGRVEMNKKLIEKVKEIKPDVVFTFLFTNELDKATIKTISKDLKIKTVNWFADDNWRYFNYSKYWAPCFDLCVTTYDSSLASYKKQGVRAVKSQWAANPALFHPVEVSSDVPEVTFVGTNYGERGELVERISSNGYSCKGFGKGFQAGRVAHEKMLEIFSGSKVNLNFSASSGFFSSGVPKTVGRLFFTKVSDGYQFIGHRLLANIQSLWARRLPQIKGRVFEVPACGGFLLTGAVPDLENYYKIGEEIEVFTNADELIQKVKSLLSNPEKTQMMAKRAYERTVAEHTYEKRFQKIFEVLC